MAHVVQEARRHHEVSFLEGEPKSLRHPPRNVADPEAVLDPRVVRPREDEVREAELADRVQPLKLQGFEEVEDDGVQAKGPVDRVRDRFELRHAVAKPVGWVNRFVGTV